MEKIFTKKELQSLYDLLAAAIIDGRGDDVINFFETDKKSDMLLKINEDDKFSHLM